MKSICRALSNTQYRPRVVVALILAFVYLTSILVFFNIEQNEKLRIAEFLVHATKNEILVRDLRTVSKFIEFARNTQFESISIKKQNLETIVETASHRKSIWQLPSLSFVLNSTDTMQPATVIYIFEYSSINTVGFALVLLVMASCAFIPIEHYLRRWLDRQRQKEHELQNALEAKNWAEQLSHDIRSPLSAIKLVAGVIADPNKKIEMILRSSVDRIDAIARETLSRRNESRLRQALDIETLTAEIVEEKKFVFADKRDLKIKTNFKLNRKIINPSFDSQVFQRILSNLINNSAEAMDFSGTINVVLSNTTNGCSVAISDSGPGIPVTILQELGRINISTKGKNGNGMGLRHAFESVKRWNGDLSISSIQSNGTVVSFSIPEEEPPAS